MEVSTNFLSIEFEEPDSVIFVRGSNVSDIEWKELSNFWYNGELPSNNPFIISTNLSDYISRRQWFKIHWRGKGRIVNVSDRLKLAIEQCNVQRSQFEMAIRGNVDFSLNDLKTDNLKREPTNEQLNNIKSSLAIMNGANFSVPGAGKTMTTLVIWNHLRLSNIVDKLLVISPKSAFEAWTGEDINETFEIPPICQIFSSGKIDKTAQILVTNYEKLENNKQLERLIRWANNNRIMMVVDEAHRIKGGAKSIRWQACKKLAVTANRVEILTGTPMPQGLEDLRNLIKIGWTGLPSTYLSDNKLRSIEPGSVFVRTTKNQLKLPPMNKTEISIEMSEIQKQIYSALRKSYVGTFNLNFRNAEELSRRGRAVMTLIASASNPGIVAGNLAEDAYLNLKWPPKEIVNDSDLMEIINNYVSYEIPPKYEWIIKFIEGSVKENKKTIIWSSFIGNLKGLKRLLSKYKPALIYGAVAKTDRELEIKKFKEKPDCFVLLTNPQTLGEGISLHKQCHQAVYLDRTYNAGHFLQSIDRIHRLGLPADTKTDVFVLSSNNSIDNRISVRLDQKISAMADLLNDTSLNTGGTIEYEDADESFETVQFDPADLSDLYSHLVEND